MHGRQAQDAGQLAVFLPDLVGALDRRRAADVWPGRAAAAAAAVAVAAGDGRGSGRRGLGGGRRRGDELLGEAE